MMPVPSLSSMYWQVLHQILWYHNSISMPFFLPTRKDLVLSCNIRQLYLSPNVIFFFKSDSSIHPTKCVKRYVKSMTTTTFMIVLAAPDCPKVIEPVTWWTWLINSVTKNWWKKKSNDLWNRRKKLKRDVEIDKMFISFQSSFSSTRRDVTVVGHWSTRLQQTQWLFEKNK